MESFIYYQALNWDSKGECLLASSEKKNCWEVKKCGRQPGGCNVHKLGVCPASVETRANGINHGKNAGRACWAIAGTLCKGEVQGTFAKKLEICLECDFYKQVWLEEKDHFVTNSDILRSLKLKKI
jgi:hypothetical protein